MPATRAGVTPDPGPDTATVHAETAYLFRHALLRAAAYELQLPADRTALHALALELIRNLAGDPPGPGEYPGAVPYTPHPGDALAEELAGHARHAAQAAHADTARLAELQSLYTWRAAEHAERCYRNDDALRLWLARADLVRGPDLGETLRRAGSAAQLCTRMDLALELFARARATQREAGHDRLGSLAAGTTASLLRQLGRTAEARAAYADALDLAARAGDAAAAARHETGLAGLLQETGDNAGAEQLYRRALPVLRQAGNTAAEAITLMRLAIALKYQRKLDEALGLLRQSLELHRYNGNLREQCAVQLNLANLLRDRGDLAGAENMLRDVLDVSGRIADLFSRGAALGNLASVLADLGRVAEAEQCYRQSVTICRETGNRRSEGVSLGNLASVCLDTGRVQQARELYEQALAIHAAVGNRPFLAMHGCSHALVLLALGEAETARARWRDSARQLAALTAPHWRQHALAEMHRDCLRAGVPAFDDPPLDQP